VVAAELAVVVPAPAAAGDVPHRMAQTTRTAAVKTKNPKMTAAGHPGLAAEQPRYDGAEQLPRRALAVAERFRHLGRLLVRRGGRTTNAVRPNG
jgi:hypothetical protein